MKVRRLSRSRQKFLLLSVVVFVCGSVHAGDIFSLYMENDSRRFKPNDSSDRHYTHGTKLVYLTQPEWQWLDTFSDWDVALDEQPAETAVGYFLGQHVYTPDHPDEPALRNAEDIPFSGWLYTGMFAQRATDHVLDHFEFNVGVIGPSSKAQQVQSCIHDFLNSNEAIGWEGQLSDELAVDFTYMQKRRLAGWDLEPTQSSDFIAEYGFTVGSVYRQAQAGLTYRYGFNLGNTFGPGQLSLPSGISDFRKMSPQSGYIYARVGGEAVEHNRFLTGLDIEPFVAQFQAGLVYQYKKFQFGYSQTFLTRQFEEQSGKDSFGAITLTWQF